MANKQYLICLLIIVILIIFAKILYSYYTVENPNILESFENAVDLLNRYKSREVQLTSEINSADIELAINPWTNKLHNLTDTKQNRPIGLYKPLLVIKGERYVKLGDMISLNNDYSPPNENEFAILIKKAGSDIKSPVGYNKIVSIGNTNIPAYYYQYDGMIYSANSLDVIKNNITNCINAITNLNNLKNKNSEVINNGILSLVGSQVNLSIGTSNPISLASFMNMKNANGNYLNTPISSTTTIILPFGIMSKITTNNNQVIPLITNILTENNEANTLIKALKTDIVFSNLTSNNIEMKSLGNINPFSFINQQELISFLQNLCNDIIKILSEPAINKSFENYVQLANNIDGVKAVLSSILLINPTLSNNSGENTLFRNNILMSYANANSNKLLGSILNIIINTRVNISYPTLTFTPADLLVNTGNMNNPINNASSFSVNEIGNIIKNVKMENVENNVNANFNLINLNLIPKYTQLIEFQDDINKNKIDYFPLVIYEPVPPTNYVALGHVFSNTENNLFNITTSNSVACVPAHCVREIRDWLPADKVFEYNKSGVYMALYKNPYTGTFKAVNQPGVPAGKLYKVVACVAKCNALDELKKADDCARKYNNINKTVMKQVKTTPDLVSSEEEMIYLYKIKMQSDNITKLKQSAQEMQTGIDKMDIVLTEKNKSDLQAYVDTQNLNINLVVDRLEKDKNSIQTNINAPPGTLEAILKMIQTSLTLSPEQKLQIIRKIVDNVKELSNGKITSGQYVAKLNQIQRTCPEYDLSGLVRKDVVADVCYGCGKP